MFLVFIRTYVAITGISVFQTFQIPPTPLKRGACVSFVSFWAVVKPMKQLLSIALVTTISLLPTLGNAQTNNFQYPQPNRQGDYTSILSKSQDGQTPHLVWKVVSNKLNCRAQAGINYRIVRLLSKEDKIDIVGKPKIYLDRQGKPWLYVAKEGNAEDLKIRCFVRANTQFIKPIAYSIS